MGSMRERPVGSGKWQLRVHLGAGQYASETVTGTIKDAKRALRRLETAADDNRAPKPTRLTVGALLEDWWATKAWKSIGGRRQAREDLDRYLIPHLGPIALNRLTDRHIADLYRGLRTPGPACLAKRGKPLGPATILRLHVNLHSALNWAVKNGRLGRNPASIVDAPASPPTKVRGPDSDDLRGLVALAMDRAEKAEADRAAGVRRRTTAGENRDFAVFVRLAAATGRRREDILGLTVADVRFEESALVFDKRAVLPGKGDGGGVVIEPLDKNARSARVDVDPETMRLLRDLVDRHKAVAKLGGMVLPKRAHLFTDDPAGVTPWRPDSTSREFRHLRDAAGMPEVTLHSLRHAHITELLEHGLDVEAVAKRVGDDPATIYRVYAHARRVSDRRAAGIMGTVLDGAERRLIAVAD